MANIKRVNIGCPAVVLPQVYGDALTYYEAIAKLQATINDLVDYINNDILISEFREYLNQYFLNAMYNTATKTLVLSLSTSEGES